MTTTTVRVDVATHALLRELAAARGASVMDTVRDAAEALRRQRFGSKVAAELATMRAGPDWAHYVDDAESTAVVDGLD